MNYIDEQYEKYLTNESGLNRRQIRDTRVHCCFYFISPLNFGLKPADVRFLKLLQHKVNVVPLIAKSDFLTPQETKQLKEKILNEIKHHRIQIYSIPDCDPDEDEDYKAHVNQLKISMPFAVCSSLDFHDVNGRKIRGRLYPWGVVETENPDHSDYIKLRSMLVSHMQDLREVTHDIHYENYRSHRLAGNVISTSISSATIHSNSLRDNISIISGSIGGYDESEKDRILQEKEAELRKMQDLLAKMKEEMHQQQSSSINNIRPEVVSLDANGHH